LLLKISWRQSCFIVYKIWRLFPQNVAKKHHADGKTYDLRYLQTIRLCIGGRMLTAKGKYGLKALVYLAALNPDEIAQASDVAKAKHIPGKFLDTILSELRAGGFVHSHKGPRGGYRLARAPTEIKIGQVIRMIDGPLAPISCASRSAYRACRTAETSKVVPLG
jgi:Rrf2 family protein